MKMTLNTPTSSALDAVPMSEQIHSESAPNSEKGGFVRLARMPSSNPHRRSYGELDIFSSTPGLRQARRKRLNARTGQDGTVYQEAMRQTDEWKPDKPCYLRIYLDIPGQFQRKKRNVPLGNCTTRDEARRKADKWIMANGINDHQQLAAALEPSEITFRSQSAWWLAEMRSGRLKSRQRNKRGQKIRVTTLDAYASAVDYLNEHIGNIAMATFDNAEMKELISRMEAEMRDEGRPRFSAKTITNYYLVVGAVFATAKDRKGKQLFPRQWDLNYIGLPAVVKKEQNTPTFESAEIETILSAAKGRYRVLYALLAASGMRISEALGLEVGKHLSADCSIVYVRQQRSKKGNSIEPYPKTDSGVRDIDLAPAVAKLLMGYLGNRKSGFLFESANRLPLSPRNIARDSLHPILKNMERESAGFHPFRRFRESIIQRSEARSLLIDYWMGHANGEMSGRYGKQLLENVLWRQECAAKVGLGFSLAAQSEHPQVIGRVAGQVGQVLRVAEQHAIAV
ncbi:MAG TPA: site-specific integrase [Candidatus Acidoferrales bacterium]